MTSTSNIPAKVIAFADGCTRQSYQTPKLSLFGDVGSLTETGSRTGMEDGFQNGMCANSFFGNVNMTFNMC